MNKLNEVRDDSASDGAAASREQEDPEPHSSSHETHHSNNRVDTTLNDVFQLLSLFFLTIGKSRESPAAYCQLATMKVTLYLHTFSTQHFVQPSVSCMHQADLEILFLAIVRSHGRVGRVHGNRPQALPIPAG